MKNKDLHVLYIITKLELGGAQKICLALMQGLPKHGQHPLLISGTQGPLVETVKQKSNVYLLPSMKREVSLIGIFYELKNFFALIAQIKKLKKKFPNLIVHTHSTKAGLIGRWAAFFAGIKTRLHTIHGYGFHPHQSKIIWFIVYLFELMTSFITTHFICVSSADVKTGIKLFPRFTYKHSIIRAAVDWQKFYVPAQRTTMQEKHVFVFGTVSCFKKQKNLIDMFKAFASAHDRNNNMRLEVIGDGALRPELEAWIAQHWLQEKIILHGWQQNVSTFMQQWDAFVMSSLWEGLPCAVVEARLQKLPVLSYNTGGIHDVINHGENGFLYHQGDWQSMADGMLELSINKKLQTKMSNAHEDLSEFDEQYMIEKHVRLYQNLCK